jgi:hypothetical protein
MESEATVSALMIIVFLLIIIAEFVIGHIPDEDD